MLKFHIKRNIFSVSRNLIIHLYTNTVPLPNHVIPHVKNITALKTDGKLRSKSRRIHIFVLI